MDDRNESTHERLNRELWRMRTHDVGFWGGWALLFAIAALFVFFGLNTAQNVRFVTGTAGQTMPLITEDGTRLILRVTVEGNLRDIRLPSQLVHPAPGETLCLRAGEHRFTGHTSYINVPMSLCEEPSATPDVE